MFKDRLIFVSGIAAAILNIILWLAVGGKFGLSTEKIPLHFNVVYGIDLLGAARQLYLLPLTGGVLLAVNVWLSSILFPREKLYSYFLSVSAALIQGILLIAVVAIIVLNG